MTEIIQWFQSSVVGLTTTVVFVVFLWFAPPKVIGALSWLILPQRRPQHIRGDGALRKVYSTSRIGKGTVRTLSTVSAKVVEDSKN